MQDSCIEFEVTGFSLTEDPVRLLRLCLLEFQRQKSCCLLQLNFEIIGPNYLTLLVYFIKMYVRLVTLKNFLQC